MTAVTSLAILKQARKLLTPAGAWCQGHTHTIVRGEVVARDLVTALNDAAQGMGMDVPASDANRAAYQMVWDATGGDGIIKFNDNLHTTQALVLFALDACIYVAEQHGEVIVPRDAVENESRNDAAVRPFATLYGKTASLIIGDEYSAGAGEHSEVLRAAGIPSEGDGGEHGCVMRAAGIPGY